MRLHRAIPSLLLAAAAILAPAAEVREEILVIVNGHIITRRTLQQAVEQEHAALYRQHSGKELDDVYLGDESVATSLKATPSSTPEASGKPDGKMLFIANCSKYK